MAVGSSAAVKEDFEESERIDGEGEYDSEGVEDDDDDWPLYDVGDMIVKIQTDLQARS